MLTGGVFSLFGVMCLFIWDGRGRLCSPTAFIGYSVICLMLLKIPWNCFFDVAFLIDLEPADFSRPLFLLALFCAIGWIVLALFRGSVPENRVWCRDSSRFHKLQFNSFAVVFAVAYPLALLGGFRFTSGFFPWEDPMSFRQITQSAGRIYFLIPVNMLTVIISVYVVEKLIIQRKLPDWRIVASIPGLLLYNIFSGLASSPLNALMFAYLYLSVRKRWRHDYMVLLAFPFVVLYALIHNQYRSEKLGDHDASFSDVAMARLSNPGGIKDLFNRLDYLEVYVAGTKVLEAKQPDLGLRMASVVVQWVPRGVWGNKPLNFSSYMTSKLLPDRFEIGSTANFNALSEFIDAFGISGVLVGGIAFGIVLSVGHLLYRTASTNAWSALIYSYLYMQYLQLGFIAGFVNDFGLANLLCTSILLFSLLKWPLTVLKLKGVS